MPVSFSHFRTLAAPPRSILAVTLTATLSILTFGLASPRALEAQSDGILPRATRVPASTRAMALGDAYQTESGHADAIFYHPALLTGASGFGIDMQRWSSVSSSTAASAAVQWLDGGVGIGLRTFQYSAPGSGDDAAPEWQDDLFDAGPVPVSERVATVAYAREALYDVDIGVAVDFIDERVGALRQNVVLLDLSASRAAGPVTVGLTVHDVGEKPVYDTGSKPSKVTLGAGNYGHQVGIFDVGYAASVGFGDETTFGAGVEIGYWPISGRTFVARLGFQDVPEDSDISPVTMGFAFWGDDITVEWAFRPLSGADEGGTHRFGVRWR